MVKIVRCGAGVSEVQEQLATALQAESDLILTQSTLQQLKAHARSERLAACI